jgi:DNA-binding response OmpR family regulator
MAPTTVLVIDDDPEMWALLKDVLEREGHRVLQEAKGERAIPTLESNHVSAVVLDKEMPGVNGMDLLAFLRRRWPDIPVIFITAFGGPTVAEEALRLGAARYLEKPFRVTELLEAMRTLIKGAGSTSSGNEAVNDTDA